ncbi:molybdopterin molybdotransferase MoeA [Shimia sp. CNT1-13L.2]|uniref:molybdopterin molybdotransferase MoeA n=1 Tax=Shimia sp. CNT1-13L.2 TaxID=2959663 RepID=UPI0020CF3949|nr:gephyrin-like molybdotransferase Glp [Shimia sp. CNT1-13L.2]MCP9481428.1 molybdopterin molybdotransferase MoeA [Shimia sp. CNT1-13L.2]
MNELKTISQAAADTAAACACSTKGLPSVEQAMERLRALVQPIRDVESVPVFDLEDRILACDVQTVCDLPLFDNAAMDGYALALDSLEGQGPWQLPVFDRIAAGQPGDTPLPAGMVARIFTGAPLPKGADLVIPQEQVVRVGDVITVQDRPSPDAHVRRSGSDMQKGRPLLSEGTRLTANRIAALAGAGIGAAKVYRRPRVALMMSGDEIRDAGAELSAGEIWDVNTPMISALVTAAGADIVARVQLSDTPLEIASAFARVAGQVDLIITSGGVSVGEEDHLHQSFIRAGGQHAFSGVAMKPGKPVSAGQIESALWLGLPGNPVAAFVGWHLFGNGILSALGHHPSETPTQTAVLGGQLEHKVGRREFRPVAVMGRDASGRPVIDPGVPVRSASLSQLLAADGMIDIAAETTTGQVGETVRFLPFVS